MCTQNNSSLMKKTKKDLINIILRKDDVHKELKSKVDEFNSKCENLYKEVDKKTKELNVFHNNEKKLNENVNNLKLENKQLTKKVEYYINENYKLEQLIETYKNNISFWRNITIVVSIILIIYVTISII